MNIKECSVIHKCDFLCGGTRMTSNLMSKNLYATIFEYLTTSTLHRSLLIP